MKQLTLALIAFVLLSCGTSKTIQQSKKTIKGQWLLETVTYSETGSFNVNLLQDASAACFEGSSWQFIPNNNTGTYAINGENCATDIRHFIFTIEDVGTEFQSFLLKPTDEKKKSATNQGFRLQLTQLTESNMTLQQTVTLEGKPFKITMNFSKK